MSNTFFISDLHLGHKSALVWARDYREGNTIEEHDQILMDKINSIVGKRDTLYILGDVTFKDNKLYMLGQLKANSLILVRGNHDGLPITEYLKYFNEIHGLYQKYSTWFSHAPVHEVELRGRINVHGHVHQNSIKTLDGEYDRRYINVGVEALNGYPVSLDEIRSGAYWERKIV